MDLEFGLLCLIPVMVLLVIIESFIRSRSDFFAIGDRIQNKNLPKWSDQKGWLVVDIDKETRHYKIKNISTGIVSTLSFDFDYVFKKHLTKDN